MDIKVTSLQSHKDGLQLQLGEQILIQCHKKDPTQFQPFIRDRMTHNINN